jgi:hypothetical protein
MKVVTSNQVTMEPPNIFGICILDRYSTNMQVYSRIRQDRVLITLDYPLVLRDQRNRAIPYPVYHAVDVTVCPDSMLSHTR